MPVRTRRQRVACAVGAVAFGSLAVIFALRGEPLSAVMAVLAAAVAITYVYLAVRKANRPR